MTAAGMPNHGIESDGCYAAAPHAKRYAYVYFRSLRRLP